MVTDGVLTDGSISYTESGDEIKSFHVRDGFAIRVALEKGFKVIVISERASKAVRKRLIELGVTDVYLGIRNKLETYHELKYLHNFSDDECLYIGDDIFDIPIMKEAGFCVCPVGSPQYLRDRVAYVTAAEGGRGSIREAIELVLTEQGKWANE
jgi:3-deoxy-D-manno-octulosonate 8-phosphate phosphatase (KDO 8-P phosphatase)